MKVTELREKCKEYELPIRGKKSELIERIIEYLDNEREYKNSNIEVETPSTEDAVDDNTYDNTEEDTPNEENSVIIYPQEEEPEIRKEEQEEETTEKEIESEKEEEKQQEEETEKETEMEIELEPEPEAAAEEKSEQLSQEITVNQEDKGDDDDGEENQRSNISVLPIQENKQQQQEKIVKFKLYNSNIGETERNQNEKDRELKIDKSNKRPVPITDINDLLQKIVKNEVKKTPPPPPKYDPADLPKMIDYSNRKPKRLIIDKSLEVKIIKRKANSPSKTPQQEPPPPAQQQQQQTPVTESPIESPTETTAEEEERRRLKRKIEKIQSVLKKKQEKENIFKIKTRQNITPQNDKSDQYSAFISSDEPPLKKAKESEEKKNTVKIEVKKPSNLCGNINTFINNKQSNNTNPSNILKTIPTFIKPPTTDDKKSQTLINHKPVETKTKFSYFSRDKNTKPSNTTTSSTKSTTTGVMKNNNLYSTKPYINNNNIKHTSHEIQQEPPPLPSKPTTTTTTTTAPIVKKESKFCYFTKKDPKDIKPKEQPVKEVIKEIIDVDQPQKSTKETDSKKNSHSSSNTNQDLSWADPETLLKTLEEQSSIIDLDKLFGEVTTCDIDEIFPNRHPKPRGSSGNWLNDAVTQEEEEKYRTETRKR